MNNLTLENDTSLSTFGNADMVPHQVILYCINSPNMIPFRSIKPKCRFKPKLFN